MPKDEAQTQEMVLRDYRVSEFRGAFPQIETDQRVDLAALTTGDEKPFFVTLPIARIGETSENGLLYDEELVKEKEIELAVQVNGKIKDKITVAAGTDEEQIKQQALASEKVVAAMSGKAPRKVIVIKSRLVNIVV